MASNLKNGDFCEKIPENKHIHEIHVTCFGANSVIAPFIMLYLKFHLFCVIAYTPNYRNSHQNQISMLNIGKVIAFLQIT